MSHRSADPPPFKGGPWEEIARRREQRLQQEAARGVPEAVAELEARANPDSAKISTTKKSVTPQPAKRNGPPKGSPQRGGVRPTYDKTQIIHMYLDKKMRIADIVRATGAHRSTIHRILGPDGADLLPPNGDKPGPLPKDGCAYGHEWKSAEDTYPGSNGGRGCRHCKRERDREAYRRKAEKSREQVHAA